MSKKDVIQILQDEIDYIKYNTERIHTDVDIITALDIAIDCVKSLRSK